MMESLNAMCLSPLGPQADILERVAGIRREACGHNMKR